MRGVLPIGKVSHHPRLMAVWGPPWGSMMAGRGPATHQHTSGIIKAYIGMRQCPETSLVRLASLTLNPKTLHPLACPVLGHPHQRLEGLLGGAWARGWHHAQHLQRRVAQRAGGG